MTRGPRRRPGRGYGLTLPPLRPYSGQESWWTNPLHPSAAFTFPTNSMNQPHVIRSETTTHRPPHTLTLSVPPTTTATPETTTSWWPPGVNLGPRSARPYLPFNLVNPKIAKWIRKSFPIVWFRTGGTRFTYPPEVENYPITFNWSVPRDRRVDRYTARPDWPLESPLFSNEVYDYLEDVTLPPRLLSGETEFPITSPEPWWTYPPWWEEKIAGEVNGTSERPVYTHRVATRPKATKLPLTSTTTAIYQVSSKTTEKVETTTEITSTQTKPSTNSDPIVKEMPKHTSEKVMHHKGPWWKLTIKQQLSPSTLLPDPSKNEQHKRIKRHSRPFRPLVRQNAIRRKRKRKQFKVTNQLYSTTKNSRLCTLSKDLLESIIKKAVDELNRLVQYHSQSQGLALKKNVESSQDVPNNEQEIRNQLLTLYRSFLTVPDLMKEKENNFFFEFVTTEISEHLQTILFSKLLKNTDSFQKSNKGSGEIKPQKFNKDKGLDNIKLVKLINFFCKHNLMTSTEITSILQILRNLFEKAEINVHDCIVLVKYQSNEKKESNLFLKDVSRNAIVILQEGVIRRSKRNGMNEFNKTLNWSPQSMEKMVDEIVDDIPMESFDNEIKADFVAELHGDQLKKLGKTNVNKEVLSKMAELDFGNGDTSKIDHVAVNSVKYVISKMLIEILSTLRKHDWMRNIMIKLFDEGFSVDSVVETIANQISIESLMDSMQKEGVNITASQKELVISHFKGYKSMLNKMLKKEVLLWEYQLAKNNTIEVRHKRNPSLESMANSNVKFQKPLGNEGWPKLIPLSLLIRVTRNDNLSPELKRVERDMAEYDKNQYKIDQELSDIEKNSMSDDTKMKTLKKRLKWLQSQTENPADIVFPENFEEELMRTENYEERKGRGPRIPKKRYQWNVRTKKPTVKVVTFLPKIRLTRGKQFVPLTTTEENLEIPETHPPTRKQRPKKPLQLKKTMDSASLTTLQSFKKNFLLNFTYKTSAPKFSPRLRVSQRPMFIRRTTQSARTYATLNTFPTMKFGTNTQKPVISLQEFLKRRDDHRRVREEVMWNRNFMASSDQGVTKAVQKDSSEGAGELSEEELGFDAKLSTEVNPGDFTLRPMSDFLYLRPALSTKSVYTTKIPIKKSSLVSDTTRRPRQMKIATTSGATKVTRRKFTRKTGYTRAPKKLDKKTSQIEKSQLKNQSAKTHKDNQEILNGSEEKRSKRDLFTNYSLRPLTNREFEKEILVTDEPLFGVRQNVSRRELELKIQSKDKTKTPINSFETYQQEHRKWFGEKRRNIPVNNFDIDWKQKMEAKSVWQNQKSEYLKPTLQITTVTPENDNSSWSKGPVLEIPEVNSFELNKSGTLQEGLYPPFGKADRDGKTAFGRLYQESKKRHYLLHDNRDLFFNKDDIKKLINKTYDTEFRIKTHRRTHWFNRTFDPQYVFTQHMRLKNISKPRFAVSEVEKNKDKMNSSQLLTSAEVQNPFNDSKTADAHFESYLNILRGHRVISIRPKHLSFRDIMNQTVVINRENDTFILHMSNKIPWDNVTDPHSYKKYRKSRKMFYNKTIDIVFSYYIFHKFHCGNASRDLGYGRMSNVINRWYNRTFVPKYRPDMFYLHNRYKKGKDLNYYKDDFNIIHAMMSEGKFDSSRWVHIIPGFNRSEDKKSRVDEEFNQVHKESAEHVKGIQQTLNSKEESREKIHSTTISKATMKMLTTLRWTRKIEPNIDRKIFATTALPIKPTKLSFFQTVKEKSFGFLKNLFIKEKPDNKNN